MSVYLIPLDQAERIAEVPPDHYAEAWDSKNPDHEAGAWATPEALDGLRAIGIEPVILAEAPTLPVFHGFGTYIDTCGYEDALAALCKARLDGEAIRGVSYVGHNCEAQVAGELVWSGDRFFYYTRKESRNFLWRVIASAQDATWCCELWRHDTNFLAWLEGLGLEDWPISGEV
ncbi:MAG: hypothetical protein FJZ90_02270 [Chloroflexi bacterium]|nr:hypothetical protein [Chloroflexota bacterium]